MWGILLLAVAALAIWAGVILWGVFTIAYISTHPPRYKHGSSPAAFEAQYEDIEFVSQDGVVLSGWYVPAKNALGAIALCHGMNSHRGDMLPWAEPLWKAGFTLLLFDFRAFGKSGGDLSTAGFLEQNDLQGAVDFLLSRPESASLSVGVFGFSMGGATAIMTTAKDLRIAACATLGAYSTVEGAIHQRCKRHFGRLARPAQWSMMLVGKWLRWFYVEPEKITPVSCAARIAPRPCLILHGTEDGIVPSHHAHDVAAAIGASAELRYLPNSSHSRLNPDSRKVAEKALVEFFTKSLASH